jgi:hypothetical protein
MQDVTDDQAPAWFFLTPYIENDYQHHVYGFEYNANDIMK